MSGECKGWSDWATFKKAGVVDDHIDFSDNKVVVDNVLGRTRDTIGKSFPIDTAVAYTLSKAGPDANLTVQDMVNEYTRTATAMMDGRVGWGEVHYTGEVDGEHYTSCGHDEIDAYHLTLNAPNLVSNEEGEKSIAIISKGWRIQSMRAFLRENRAPDDIQALSVLRMNAINPFTDDWMDHKKTNRTYVLDATRCDTESEAFDSGFGAVLRLADVMMSERMRPLKEWLENHFDCQRWNFGEASIDSEGVADYRWTQLSQVTSYKRTRGVCGFSLDGSQRYCTYHNADYMSSDDWWMVTKKGKTNEFVKVWNGARCSAYWNRQMFETDGKWYHGRQVVRWSDVRRKMANSIDEAEVKRQIKKALNRMTKRTYNIVSLTRGEMGDGAPEDRTYRWKDWSWLAVIQNAVAQTSKKLRKEGDVVTGWKYTKTASKTSYGHEIAEFEWQPADEICTYIVSVEPEGGYSYYSSTNALPFRFKTADEAVKFNKMLGMIATKAGASGFHRTWDKDAGKEAPVDCDRLKVSKVYHTKELRMEMSKEPEDLPSPTEVVEKVFFGLPNEYGPAVEHLEGDPFKEFKVKVNEEMVE